MTGQRYQLKATKTRFYDLVKRYFEVPVACRQTKFINQSRDRDYSLKFLYEGKEYRFYLTERLGKVVLSRMVGIPFDVYGRTWDAVDIQPAELLELRLAEPITETTNQ